MLRKDIYNYLIIPTLKEIDLYSPEAAILVYGTGMVETGYDYLYQIGNPKNGGISPFQIQPSDYLDGCTWLLYEDNKKLLGNILQSAYLISLPQNPNILAWNLKFAIAMCRVHYWRIKEKLPQDAKGMAAYHKKYYNSFSGKADPAKNELVFQRLMDEIEHDNS